MKDFSQRSSRFFYAILFSNFLLSIHFFLILYINSSFLDQYFSAIALSSLFIAGAIINLILLLSAPSLLKKFGNRNLALLFIVLEFIAVLGFVFAEMSWLVALLFLLHQSIIMMVLFNLDIFLEEYSGKNESQTGSIRGIFLLTSNIAAIVSPAIAGFILTNGDYWKIYLLSSLFLIPLFLNIKTYLKTDRSSAIYESLKNNFKELWRNKDIYNIFIIQLILQFFYVWMVVYMPIHLHTNIGFDWTKIGLIFTIMLLPFLIFTFPLGRLADRRTGEKEILITGFLIMAFTTALIPFMKEANFIFWAGLLFATRIGASFVEIAAESYFFKHVNAANPGTIGLFRITRPLAFIKAPLVAIISIYLLSLLDMPFQFIFLILSAVVLLGVRYSFKLKDTR